MLPTLEEHSGMRQPVKSEVAFFGIGGSDATYFVYDPGHVPTDEQLEDKRKFDKKMCDCYGYHCVLNFDKLYREFFPGIPGTERVSQTYDH